MTRIGTNVLRTDKGLTRKRYDNEDREKVFESMKNSPYPVRMQDVMNKFRVSNYTAKAILMDLMMENKIEAFRSGKEVFYRPKEVILKLFPEITDRGDRLVVLGKTKEITIRKSDLRKLLETKTVDQIAQTAHTRLLEKGESVELDALKSAFAKVEKHSHNE